MPNKCCVTGCRTNYQDGPSKSVFKFPDDPVLSNKWVAFLNRRDYQISKYSEICSDHFEEKFIIQHPKKIVLNYSMKPIPTIHPSLIPLSLVSVPSEPRKPPVVRIFKPKELESFKSSYEINNFEDEYSDLQTDISNDSITSYRVVICSGIATVKECIHVDSNLHVKLSYEGCPIPLPGYIDRAKRSNLISLDMFTNIFSELIKLKYYLKGRPP